MNVNGFRLLICILLLMSCMAFRGYAEEPAAEKTWQSEAVVQLDLDEYDAARKIAKTHRQENRTQSKIILMAADLKQYDRDHDKQTLTAARTAGKELDDEVTMKDVALLSEINELGGKQLTVYVGKLLEQAVNKVGSPEDIDYALEALEDLPKDQKPVIINAIGTWLAAEREKINQGRALDDDVQAVFTNQLLLETLVDQVQTEVPMKQKAMDMLPEKIKKALSSATDTFDAADCLVLIEAPALPVVQANSARLGPHAVTLEQNIKIAISTREIRFPGSTWNSATPPKP